MIDLLECRKQIDEIDNEILELFEKRMKVCEDVARFKIVTGKKVLDPQREQEKISTLCGKVHGEFNELGVKELFQQIMAISRKRQYQLLTENGVEEERGFKLVDKLSMEAANVVFQGVEDDYSYAVMRAYFGEDIKSFHVKTWRDAMEVVSNGDADYAVFPIENSTDGVVADIYDLLIEYKLYIVGEYTSGLAKNVGEDADKTQTAIASREVEKIYGLKVLTENICHNEQNIIKFIIIGKDPLYTKKSKKISVCFELPHASGTLYNMLSHMIYNGLNMIKIESRPIPGKTWEYRFFVDFEGNLLDSAVKNALRGLEAEANTMRVLGNYELQEED